MLLQDYAPGVDLDDPALDAGTPAREQSRTKQDRSQKSTQYKASPPSAAKVGDGGEEEKDLMLESMVENTGSLDLDDDGNWDFYGHSSGRAFLRKMREQFGALVGKSELYSYAMPTEKQRAGSQPTPSPVPSLQAPLRSQTPSTQDLPPRHCARLLCQWTLTDACAVLRFVHQPSFYTMLDRVYETSPEKLGPEEHKFLPLLYSVIAVGALFAKSDNSELVTNGFQNAIEQG